MPGSSRSTSTSGRRPAWRTWPSSPRNASRSSAGPGPNTSPGSNGSSKVAARRCASRTCRLSGSRRASSGVPSSRNSGWWMTYWSTGRARRHEDRDARAQPPARPPELLPCRGDGARVARPGSRRPAGRCRRRARARSWRRRRGPRRRAGRARSTGARSAGIRPGSRGPGCADRSSRAATRADRSAAARPRPGSVRRRSSAGPRAGRAVPSAGRA